jgi:hypothetical protein
MDEVFGKGSWREALAIHVIVLDEVHLVPILAKYFAYYNGTRCHLSLAAMRRTSGESRGPSWGR